MSRAHPKVLLFQARRPDDPMRQQEVQCFVDRTSLPVEAIVPWDLLEGVPRNGELASFDAVMVGGSGDFYVSRRDLPGFDALLGFLRELVDTGKPTFASCFGYQCLVEALGGEIVHDPPNTEVGTYALSLTESGADDELFGALPATFQAQMGHKDRAVRHPDGIPNLAASAASPFQALRVPGKPVWASQFHPELCRTTNLERFTYYLDGYARHMSDEEREVAFARFKESPEASDLLGRFLALVFD